MRSTLKACSGVQPPQEKTLEYPPTHPTPAVFAVQPLAYSIHGTTKSFEVMN